MLDFINKGLAKLFGTKSDKDLRLIQPKVALINGEYAQLMGISDEELRGKTIYLKDFIQDQLKPIDERIQKIRDQIGEQPQMDLGTKENLFAEIDKIRKERDQQLEKVLENILPQAFAVVKETARRFKENGKLVVKATTWDRECAALRAVGAGGKATEIDGENAIWHNQWKAAGNMLTWDMLHYDVQLIGGIVLHEGKIAEMATGEGKTLVATLPAYLNALAGLGVHIVTVNDYLAKRDSEWMSPLFEFHGISVDCIDKHQPNSPARRKAYAAGITYGTNNEFGFDYLRDNMSREIDELVQGKLHYAMVDEVDSVLIDDARTPLIISGPVPLDLEKQEYVMLKPRVMRLVDEQQKLVRDFLNEAKKKIGTNTENEGALALFRAFRGLPKSKPLIKYLSETGIKQKMQKVENHYLQDNSRLMPEADEPLFFTIDEKNNSIELTAKGIQLITATGEDESFFVLPDIGTKIAQIQKDNSLEDAEKLIRIDQLKQEYALKARRIHAINQLLKAYTLFEKDVEYIVDEGKVKIVDEQTGRVLDGRRYSDGLHQALEAKENVKIEDATQTYATVTLQNYFRMYHKLAGMTGTAETEAGEFWEIYKLDVVVIPTNRPITRKDMEDKVYKTTREKFNAVAQEIQNLTAQGRPVLVGTTSVEISETLSRMLQMRKIPHQVLNAKQHAREADVVAFAGQSGTVTIATNMAGRGTDIKLSPESKAAGGLAIIGTERHESRRVDRQLRGRSGRQGDPGSSQFFVSLEDNLMRLFGSDRMSKVMDRLGLEEGEVIQHSMITKSIERAQKKVEENNFAIRKRLLEYDNVMNSQREVIYKRRRNALYGERLALDIMTLFYDTAENIVRNNIADHEEMRLEILHNLGIILAPDELQEKDADRILAKVYDKAYKAYQEKMAQIAQQAYQILAPFYAQEGDRVKEVGIAFSDQKKIIQVVTNLEQLVNTEGKALIKSLEQSVVLAIIDQLWKEHLRDMDDLRQQVSFAHLEQKDPLLIYKFEAFELFKRFIAELNADITSFLAKVHVYQEAQPEVVVQQAPQPPQPKVQTQKAEVQSVLSTESDNTKVAQKEVEVTRPIIAEKLPNRNDKVSVRYHDGRVVRDVKFKKVEEDFKQNLCILI